MFDWKIVLAVFITLWGIAIGMAHGAINVSEFNAGNLNIGNLGISDFFGIFSGKSEIPLTTYFTTSEFPTTTKFFRFPISAMKLTYNPKNGKVLVRGSEIYTTSGNITLNIENFQGLITFGDSLNINGYAGALKFGDIFLKNAKISTKDLTAEKLEISGFPKVSFTFDSIKGNISSSGTNIFVEGKPVSIKGFEGKAVFDYLNQEYYFDGTVSRLSIQGMPFIKFTK